MFVTILTLLAPQGAWADITTHGELVSAISNASEGGTVTIGGNFSLDGDITVDKNLTIDFNNHQINSSGYTIIVSIRKTLILTSENRGGIAGAAVTSPVSLRSDGKAYLKGNAYAEGIAYSNAVVIFANPSQSDGYREAYFNSLSDAVAATSTYTCTLKLYDDVTDVASSISLGNAAGVTLDLNGKKLQGQLNSSGSIIKVPTNTKLTIIDSGTGGLVWNNTDRTGNCFALDNCGMLEIEGGTFQTRGAANYVIKNENGAMLTVSGGTIGKAKTNNIAIADDGGTTNISGGTIRFEQTGIVCYGTLHVSGGTFDTTDSYSDSGTGIYFYGKEGNSFKITALPTFQGKMGLNIAIEANGTNVPIDFTDAEGAIFTAAPANKLKIGYPDPTDGTYALTKGYSTHFVGEDGVIAPDEVFALPESAWGGLYLYNDEVYVAAATVTIGESTTPYGTLAAAATAANAATGAATIKMLANVYVSGFTQLGSAAGVTLDLNGHTISGSLNGPPIVYVTGKATITDLSESHQGKIKNTQMSSVCVAVSAEGNLTVNNVTIIGGNIAINNGGALTVGNATITANNVYEGGSKIGIQNSGTLTLTALPDFSGNDCDIYIINGSKIGIGGDITALPGNFSRITLRVQEPTIGDNYQDVKLPFAFTNGYGGHCTTIDPANLFEYRNKNGECTIQLVAGEAVAVADGKPLVAVNTDADSNITGLYAQNGTDITTDGAALAAAVTALADGETLTLCKDVEDVSNTINIGTGTAAQPVTIDLNGHAVTGSATGAIFEVNSASDEAHVVIKNGTVVNSKNTGNAIRNVDKLELINVSATAADAISNVMGTLKMTGGTVTATGNFGAAITNNSSATATINGVEATGDIGIYNNASLTVTGGTIEGKKEAAIQNVRNAESCNIGAVTIKSNGVPGIQTCKNVTFTAWPTFSGNSEDIDLSDGAKIVLGDGFAVPATEYSPIIVDMADDYYGKAFTTGFSADAVGADVWQVFAGRNATYVVDADEQGQGVIYDCAKTLSFPSGLSTYYSAESLMPAETDDYYSAFVVTGVTDGAVVVKQLPSGIIPANTPVIVRNTSESNLGITFVTDQVAWKKTEYAATIAADLGEATPAGEFVGTATDITAYEPANGATLYGFNGAAFVRLDEKPDIAAHRCWLEIPQTNGSNAARRLTIVFGDGDTTGIQTSPLTSPLEGAGSGSAWYSLDGRQLTGTPKTKGIYVRQGKKYVVK